MMILKHCTSNQTCAPFPTRYVKEDLIIPQTNSFYDFIVSRARSEPAHIGFNVVEL